MLANLQFSAPLGEVCRQNFDLPVTFWAMLPLFIELVAELEAGAF